MQLLKSFHGKYDMDHALVLCKLYHYEKGILYLYAKLHYFAEILQHHIEHEQHGRIISVCIKYGATLPSLWVQALTHFAKLNDSQYEDEITQVLEVVERMNLLAPLMVIQILAGKGDGSKGGGGGAGKPISVIQDYIVKLLKNEQAIITKDTAEIVRYQHDTGVMKEEIHKLTTQPVIFQVGKCSGCGAALSLPAVHFLCMHSYHLRCCDGGRGGLDAEFPSSTAAGYECVKCAAEYRKVKEIKDSMRQSATQHDRFFKQLDDSADGFATVAEYFGRGVFDDSKDKPAGA
jgi:vacuolar protein sorting-associated protein 11